MSTYVFRNGTCINRGRMEVTDILVRNGRISVMPLEAVEYQRILDHSEGKV